MTLIDQAGNPEPFAVHDVLIVGAGPTGLALAGELALAGVDVAVIERRKDQRITGTRALGLHSRVIEMLDQRGIADRFIAAGTAYPFVHFHVPLDISDFPTRHNYLLALPQSRTEQLLAEWVAELPVKFYRGTDAVALAGGADFVEVTLATRARLRGAYVVGCDGGQSMVRKSAGIGFPGWPASTSWLMAEVRTRDEPIWGFHIDGAGAQHAIARADDESHARMVLVEPVVGDGRPTLDDVRQVLMAAYGTDFGIHSPVWISRFTDMARQADRYRSGRVLLAGDAAHIHGPLGGQGLGIGVQDAMNLGWKLAQVVKGQSPEPLLDTYQLERHPVGARVLENTMALSAARRTDPQSRALSRYFAEMLAFEEPRVRIVAEISGLGTCYDLGEGHPLLGKRMPDLDLVTGSGAKRLYTLLHDARPVLLNLGGQPESRFQAWTDRVQFVDASCDAPCILPVDGKIPAPPLVLLRPDGYVAWAGNYDDASLEDALERWFGPASI